MDGCARRFARPVDSLAAGISVIYQEPDLADEMTVLRDGHVVYSGPAAEVTIPQLIRFMVGRELTEFFPPRRVALSNTRLSVRQLSSTSGIDVAVDKIARVKAAE